MASAMIDVYVKLTTGAVTEFPVSPSTTIREICEKVAEHEGVPAKCVVLKYTGKVLKKQHTVSYLGVRQETILKTEIQPLKTLNLIIKKEGTGGGATFPIAIQNHSFILELKEKIYEKEKITPSSQRLKFKGRVLSDKFNIETVQDCCIEDECIIALSRNTCCRQDVKEELDKDSKQDLLSSFAAGLSSDKKVEVVFSFDTTGSMYSYLKEIRNHLRDTVTRLLRDIPNIRIGIIAHGDYCDLQFGNVIRYVDITSQVDQLVEFVDKVPSSTGEGNYACYEWVLKKSQELDWTEDAAKALVILGDVVPHGVAHTDQRINWHDELDRLCQRDIKVYGVQVQDYDPATKFYQHLADKSGGAYIQFQHFHLIVDMFLAVCYRETGDDQLQAYCEEVAIEGRMTEELNTVLTQLKETPTESKEEQNEKRLTRYVASEWWDPSLDNGEMTCYMYDSKTDTWSGYCGDGSIVGSTNTTGSSSRSNLRVKNSFRRLRQWGKGILKKN